ncbi:hypothetical protein A9Q86_01345 [Flavobacteriales bacterium 33_180_T64]|nr:hypothetical protein A9Q86_01345 [Flavobacteriales bacterium 33_180_T64]
MIKKTVVLFFIILGTNQVITAQEHDDKEPGLELVLSGLSIYNTETETTNFATEIHLTYWTSHKWAFGIGHTLVFEEGNRIDHEIAALISHKPYSFLTVNTGPSFSLPNSHKDTEISAYAEAEFAFELGDIHTGPTIGSLIGDQFKIFGGWHFSYEF